MSKKSKDEGITQIESVSLDDLEAKINAEDKAESKDIATDLVIGESFSDNDDGDSFDIKTDNTVIEVPEVDEPDAEVVVETKSTTVANPTGFKPSEVIEKLSLKVKDYYSKYQAEQDEIANLKKTVETLGVDKNIDMDEFNADPVLHLQKMSKAMKSEIREYMDIQDSIRAKEESSKQRLKSAQNEFDNYTRNMFPELSDQNSELFKETQKEYQYIVGLNSNALNEPDLVYNAASRAYSRLALSGRSDDKVKKHEMVRNSKLKQAVTEKPTAPRNRAGSTGNYTPTQRRVADVMGLDLSIYDK